MIGIPLLALGAALVAWILARRERRAVRALEATRSRSAALLSQLPDVTLLVFDRDLRFTQVEGGALAAHGWPREDLIGRRMPDLLPADRVRKLLPAWEGALRGERCTVEFAGVRDTAAVYVIDHLPVREAGAVTAGMAVVRDVTRERGLLRSLEAQRGFLGAVLEELSDRVSAADDAGRLVRFDAEAGGLVAEEVPPLEWGRRLGLLAPEGEGPLPVQEVPLYRALAGQEVRDAELLADGPAGPRRLLVSARPVTGADGRRLGAVSTATDLTAYRDAQDRLREGEERYRRVMENVSDCVFQTDPDGRWTFLSDAWARLTGHAIDASLGQPCWELVHPEDRAAHALALASVLGGTRDEVELRHRFGTASGAFRWAELRARRVRVGGRPAGLAGVIRDVTDDELARRHAAAEQAVARVLAGAGDVEAAAGGLLDTVGRHLGWDCVELWRHDPADERLHCTEAWSAPGTDHSGFDGLHTRAALEIGDDLAGVAWASRRPVWREDLATGAGARGASAAASGLVSGVGVAIRGAEGTLAVLALYSRAPRAAEPGVLRVLDSVAGQLAQFLQRHDAERRVAEQAADLRVLSRVAHVLATQTDMDAARAAICEGTREVAAAHVVVLWELAGEGDALEVSAAAGLDAGAMRIELGRGCAAGMAFASGLALFSGDLRRDPRVPRGWTDATGGASAYFAPVLQDGRSAGVLGVVWQEHRTELPARLTELLDLLAGEAAVTVHRTALLAQLSAVARTDPLTGLANRRVWDEDLARELARTRRHGGRICLVMLDLDHFKAYNDRHGHQAGDQLLKSTAAAWRDTLRPTDTLARYGGEEFALLLPHTDPEDAERAVARLLDVVPLGRTASAGIAAWDGTETEEALVARADAALYAAKAAGRSRAVLAG